MGARPLQDLTHFAVMAPRHRKPSRKQVEDDLLSAPRWSGYRTQQRLQSRNHTAAENKAARDACRALIDHGCGAIAPDQHGGFPDGW